MDTLSHEYGWTTEQILSLTWSELDWRLKEISKRHDYDRRFNASLHGVNLKPSVTGSKNNSKPVKLTKEKQLAIDKAISESQKRISKLWQQN